MTHSEAFLMAARGVCRDLNPYRLDCLAGALLDLRMGGGRLFILGVGGSAANASHAVNDFRKLCGIEAYAPTDNVSELSARTNDEGWHTVFEEWLKISRLSDKDAIFVLSVNGGRDTVSYNLTRAILYAKGVGAKIYGVVGSHTGTAAKYGDLVIVIPPTDWVTPMSEAFQAVVWHCLVSHPLLREKDELYTGTNQGDEARRIAASDLCWARGGLSLNDPDGHVAGSAGESAD